MSFGIYECTSYQSGFTILLRLLHDLLIPGFKLHTYHEVYKRMKIILKQEGRAETILLPRKGITNWLSQIHTAWFTLYVSLSAFGLYTCVYAFRKTFAAATFETTMLFGIDYKVWLVSAQVLGYALSKFLGIRVISEAKAESRSAGILIMVAIAGCSWLMFGLISAPYNLIFLFFNGLSLGLVWGMVFGYLEGRRVTEVLGAALSISFIFSSGLCRSSGAYIIRYWHISESWMPFVACCLFTIPLLGFLFLLDKVPPPTPEDEHSRTKRLPMNRTERKKFVATFLPGIILFVVGYMLLTTFRDFRDNFSAEVWRELGYKNSPGIYTGTEIPVAIVVMIIMAALMLIKNNKTALMVNHLVIISGMILIGFSTMLFQQGLIDPSLWMVLIGLGLYLGYVPFNCIFFDRLLAAFQYIGTVGFIMYVADAFGYLGSVGVLFFKEFGNSKMSWLGFMIHTGYITSVVGIFLVTASMAYFHFKHHKLKKSATGHKRS